MQWMNRSSCSNKYGSHPLSSNTFVPLGTFWRAVCSSRAHISAHSFKNRKQWPKFAVNWAQNSHQNKWKIDQFLCIGLNIFVKIHSNCKRKFLVFKLLARYRYTSEIIWHARIFSISFAHTQRHQYTAETKKAHITFRLSDCTQRVCAMNETTSGKWERARMLCAPFTGRTTKRADQQYQYSIVSLFSVAKQVFSTRECEEILSNQWKWKK